MKKQQTQTLEQKHEQSQNTKIMKHNKFKEHHMKQTKQTNTGTTHRKKQK